MVGWREWAALPDLGVDCLDAKVDTGAKSSVLGVADIRQLCVGGKSLVEFGLQPGKGPEIYCQAPYGGMRTIRSSNGEEEKRVVIKTSIGLGEKLWKIDLTLTNRDAMEFQLLIGRDALGRKFLVNPAATYLLGR